MKNTSLLLSLLFVFVICSPSIWGAPIPISSCAKINASGSYVLTKNITATAAAMKPVWPSPTFLSCIIIAADNVTLDLAGYVITGPGSANTSGVSQDTTTRNGDVVHSGAVNNFETGVMFAGSGHTIQNINASKNGDGIYIHLQSGNRVIGNTANNNSRYGLNIESCPNVLLENMANGNAIADIYDRGSCDVRQENSPSP
ncbi:MAG: hypothetical protein M3O09_14735 [Acidobacteriota bacterium]|nr:hypothetical protein [Acidobacteriota bacterium]